MPRLKPFRFRPRSRVKAAEADKRRPNLTRERSSRLFLRRRDQEPSKGKAAPWLRRDGRPDRREAIGTSRLLDRERRDQRRRIFFDLQNEEESRLPALLNQFFEPDKPRQNVCQTRATRRAVLFAAQIAGKKGRSPGKGGTYKRTPESNISCERSF